jgi:hypothetical protein
VRKAAPEDGAYLAKYVAKDFTVHGVRKWASIGAFQGVRVRDIETDSLTTRATKYIMETCFINERQHARFSLASSALRTRPDLIAPIAAGGLGARRAVTEILSGRLPGTIPGGVRPARLEQGCGVYSIERQGGRLAVLPKITRVDIEALRDGDANHYDGRVLERVALSPVEFAGTL